MVQKTGIELVITAQNKGAEKPIINLVKALKMFSATTGIAGKDSVDFATKITKVGKGLNDLEKIIGGGDALALISKEMGNARTKTEGFNQVVQKSAGGYVKLQTDLLKVKEQLRGVREELEKSTPAYDKQSKATNKYQMALDTLIKKEASLAKRREKQVESQKLQNTLLRKGSALTDKQRIREQNRLNLINQNIHAIDKESRANARKQITQERHLTRERALLAPLIADRQRLLALEGSLATTGRGLARQVPGAGAALGKKVTDRDKETAELKQLEVAAAEANQELLKVQKTLNSTLSTAQSKAAKETRDLYTEWQRLEAHAKQLALDTKQLGYSTTESSAAFNRAKEAARATKLAYKSNIATIREYKKLLAQPVSVPGQAAQKFNQAKGLLGRVNKVSEQNLANPTVKRVSADIRKLGREHLKTAQATRTHARAQITLQQVMAKFYGNNRIQLSILQRLRTELHSTILAYGGFFAAFRGLGAVVQSVKTLQKAENRLRTVVGDDARLIGAELDFVRRNAKRLGIEFGLLSNEYTKFSIATKNTNLQGKHTRDIFLSMAEAARVNGASNEDLSGAFLALTQIVSKGTVTMEELKRQLGDRVAGAVHIMADALGVGTAELFKMVEAGEVTSDALIKFADEMDKRFGPALSKALRSTQAQLGRLSHSLFQLELRIARGGFIDAFNGLLQSISATLATPEFQSFADRISTALSGLTKFVGFAIENFRTLVKVISAVVAAKLAPFIAFAVFKLHGLGGVLKKVNAGLSVYNFLMQGGAKRTQAFAGAMTFLGFSAGGVIAVLTVLGVVAGWVLGGMITSATDANEVFTAHEEIMDKIKNAWDKAAGSAEKLVQAISKLNKAQLITESIKADKLSAESTKQLANSIKNTSTNPATAYDSTASGATEQGQVFAVVRAHFANIRAKANEIIETGDLKLLKEFEATYEDSLSKILDIYELIDKTNGAIHEGIKDDFVTSNALITDAIKKSRVALEYKKAIVIKTAQEEGRTSDVVTETQGLVKEKLAADELAEAIFKLDKRVNEFTKDIGKSKDQIKLDSAEKGAIKNYEELNREIKALQEGLSTTSDEYKQLEDLDTQALEGLQTTLVDINREWAKSLFKSASATDFGKPIALIENVTGKVSDLAKELRALNGLSKRLSAGDSLFDSLDKDSQSAVLAAYRINAKSQPNHGRGSGLNTALAGDNIGDLISELEKIDPIAAQIIKDGDAARAIKLIGEETADKKAETDAINDLATAQNANNIARIALTDERRAAGLQAMADFAASNPTASPGQLLTARKTGLEAYDISQIDKDANKAKTPQQLADEAAKAAKALISKKDDTEERFYAERANVKDGQYSDSPVLNGLKAQAAELGVSIPQAIDVAIAKYKALKNAGSAQNQQAIAELELLKAQHLNTANIIQITWEEAAETLGDAISGGIDKWIEEFVKTKDEVKSLERAFTHFASSFLIQIGQMIQQQAALGAANAIIGGLSGAFLPKFHTGGVVGAGGQTTRYVALPNAIRYHTGGLAGLAPDEVPALLKAGEEVLTEGDPRHRNNGGLDSKQSGQPVSVTTIVVADEKEGNDRYFDTPEGEGKIVRIVNKMMGS